MRDPGGRKITTASLARKETETQNPENTVKQRSQSGGGLINTRTPDRRSKLTTRSSSIREHQVGRIPQPSEKRR
jgi:hypothetical protein